MTHGMRLFVVGLITWLGPIAILFFPEGDILFRAVVATAIFCVGSFAMAFLAFTYPTEDEDD